MLRCVVSLFSLIQQFTEPRQAKVKCFSLPPCFRLILTFCFYFYGFLRELDLAFGRPLGRVGTHSFYEQTRWSQDLNNVMELWALRPHAIFVKMIFTLGSRRTFQSDLALCGLHEFLRLNVADIHEGISEKVSGTVSASAFLLDMTVMSLSGVILSPSDVPARQIQPLITVVSIIDVVSTVTPFVVPPPPDIEQLVMQAQDFSNCRLTKSREFLSSSRLSASSPVPMLPRDPAKDSSPFLSLGRVPPLRGDKSPPAGEALLQPRQMTVWFRVWMFQTLPDGVGCF